VYSMVDPILGIWLTLAISGRRQPVRCIAWLGQLVSPNPPKHLFSYLWVRFETEYLAILNRNSNLIASN